MRRCRGRADREGQEHRPGEGLRLRSLRGTSERGVLHNLNSGVAFTAFTFYLYVTLNGGADIKSGLESSSVEAEAKQTGLGCVQRKGVKLWGEGN